MATSTADVKLGIMPTFKIRLINMFVGVLIAAYICISGEGDDIKG